MSFVSRPIREEKKPSRFRKFAVIGTGILEAAVHLYRQMKHREEKEKEEQKRVRVLKRTMVILVSGLLILLLLIGTLKFLVRLKAISLGSMVSAVSSHPGKDDHGMTNVLLLGEGDSDHSGIDLTDTVMVVSLDPKTTKSAVMLSLPRDLYFLSTDKMGKGRINSLYRDYKNQLLRSGMDQGNAAKESMRQLAREIGAVLGLQIHGVIKLNFSGFEQGIDAIGGIDIDVPDDLLDTQYPGPNYSYETFSLAKGPQHLDGATALKYARSRHSTSDFSRSGRQQQIIIAASEKAKSMGLLKNLGKVSDILSIIARNMHTTFEARELLGLTELAKNIDRSNIINIQLSDQNGLYGGLSKSGGFLYAPPREEFEGASVFLPVSMPEFPVTWKQIQGLQKLLTTEREAFLRPPSIMILNAGAISGAARALGDEMTRYGFNVIKTRNFSKPNTAFDRSWFALRPSDPALKDHAEATLALLTKLLTMTENRTPEALSFGEEQPDIVIVLGKDYHYTPLQNLVP